MFELMRNWYREHFSDPAFLTLALALSLILALLLLLDQFLGPLFVAILLAYLLDGLVNLLYKTGTSRLLAVCLVLLLSFLLLLFLLLGLIPIMSQQVSQLLHQLPDILSSGHRLLLALPESYPTLIAPEQVDSLWQLLRTEMARWGQQFLSRSVHRATDLLAFGLYLVLLPLLVFFFLKDKELIKQWGQQFLPRRRELLLQVWQEVDQKIAAYIRGKCLEILIVWVSCYLLFSLLGLRFSLLLSFLVGISVIIPYAGAVAVTVPVALIGFFQWGLSSSFSYLMLIYLAIQIIDGNLLVPLLFSEVVNLHPAAIVTAILFFGGLWGLWGVFFAIPLATLLQAVLNAWSLSRTPPATS